MRATLPALSALNTMTPHDFAAAVAPLFEGARRFLRALAAARPFASDEALIAAARSVARSVPRDVQVELLDAHPRIGADPSSVSDLSRVEQGHGQPSDGDRAAARALSARLVELNDAYEARCGFRFVVFVAGRSREEIVPILERALHADADVELARGLDDVMSIAADRLTKLRAAGA